ncbi:MAG TPA: pitrilysin family protein [Thermoanaerobaculia bacterium]|nr:pitrilysin family protein [Thermoanaerobaculia bacterium]
MKRLVLILCIVLSASGATWPKRIEKKLDNGLTVVLVPMANVPKITADIIFLTRNGATAQLAARVANEGTATRTSKELKDELRSIGGQLAIRTDRDATTIAGSALSENAPKLFELMSDVARNASFPKEEVELAKQNLAGEIEEQRSNPQFLADERLQKALFGSHPYGFVVPDAKSIKAATREQLRAYAAANYVPNNATLIIVGDFEPDTALSEVRKAFGSWKKVPVTAAALPALPKRDKRQIHFVDRPGSVQSVIVLGTTAPPRKSADYLPLRTADTIAGGGFISRLNHNLREAKGYTYGAFSGATLWRSAGEMTAGAAVRNEVTGPALLELLYELDRMRVSPVTKEELDAAKTYSTGNLSLEMETQRGAANRIATIYTYQLAPDFLETFNDKLAVLTAEDIQRAAAKYFDTYRSAIVIVGDWAAVKEQVTPFGDVTLYDESGNPKSK